MNMPKSINLPLWIQTYGLNKAQITALFCKRKPLALNLWNLRAGDATQNQNIIRAIIGTGIDFKYYSYSICSQKLPGPIWNFPFLELPNRKVRQGQRATYMKTLKAIRKEEFQEY